MEKMLESKKKFDDYFNLIRFKQPIGFFLLFWPCFWGIILASDRMPDFKLITIFLLGSFLMRSAGCIINDLVDMDYDAKVKRTQNRPLASLKISKVQAIITLIILLFLSFCLLLLLNKTAIKWALFSIILVILYPFMKRITYWPQAFLGLTFNYGIIVSYLAVKEEFNIVIFILYISGICWTLAYDTIYAYMDLDDDVKIGLKSTAVLFAEKGADWITKFYTIFLVCILMAGKICNLSIYFYYGYLIILILICTIIYQFKYDDKESCLKLFKANNYIGIMVSISFLVGKILEIE